MNTLITPVILAGGIGSRLWPLSRQAMPKQFLPLLSESTSLLQSTLARVSNELFDNAILVCNEQHRFIAAEQAESSIPTALLLEPKGKACHRISRPLCAAKWDYRPAISDACRSSY